MGIWPPPRGFARATLLALAFVAGSFGLGNGPSSAQDAIREEEDASLVISGDFDGDNLSGVAIADVDGDGMVDLILSAPGAGEIIVIPGPVQAGSFQALELAAVSIRVASGAGPLAALAAGDINADGISDIVAADGDQSFAVVFGNADFFFGAAFPRTIPVLANSSLLSLAVADLNGDGLDDIVYTSPAEARGDTLANGDEAIILYAPFTETETGDLAQANVGRIRGISGSFFFGIGVAAGDLTGDGRADLVTPWERSSVALFAGPILPGLRVISDDGFGPDVIIPSDNGLTVVGLAIADANLDGTNDLLVGTPFADAAFVVPGERVSSARFPFLEIVVDTLLLGESFSDFGTHIAVGDYDGDGGADIVVGAPLAAGGAGSVLGFAAADRGPLIAGVDPPSGVAGASLELEIHGQGLINPVVVLSGPGDVEVELETTSDSLSLARAVLPADVSVGLKDVVVRTDIGEAVLEGAFRVRSGAHSVLLLDGWNLVGWTGQGSVADAVASLAGDVEVIFGWDPVLQEFKNFRPRGPRDLNTLDELQPGEGLWVRLSGPGLWRQPTPSGARDVPLEPGANLVTWTGPDQAPVKTAVADLGDALTALFTWDADEQRFLRYSPGSPDRVNDARTLNFGHGVWVFVDRAVVWPQPDATSLVDVEVATSVPEAAAAIVFVDRDIAVASGFVVSDRQILTNAHVVGGAATVTIRFVGGEERVGRVTAVDGPLDVAVIEVSDLPEGVRRLDWETAEAPVVGTPVWIWGFPGGEIFGENTAPTVSAGIVSATQIDEVDGEEFSVLQTDAALNPGNSGGPVILADGRVIGISDFIIILSGSDAEGLNFAIDVVADRDRIRALLAR